MNHASPAAALVDSSTLDDAIRFDVGSAGDHAAVQQFMSSVFHTLDRDMIHASFEDPFYEPCDRLLVKRGSSVLAHAHVTRRAMHVGDQTVPIAGLHALGTLDEYRGRGFGTELLTRAARHMRDDQAMAGVLCTNAPHFFRRAGWVVCGRHSHAHAGTREILAELSARGAPAAAARLNIRPWRQVELPALMRIYGQFAHRVTGLVDRSEAYWRWLIGRKGYDQLYVAIDGPDRLDFEAFNSPIVGYCFTKDDRILELAAARSHEYVAERLLARACGDAIERDMHSVQLHAAPSDVLFDVFRAAGGVIHHHEVDQGMVFMAKLLDPWGLVRAMGPELHRRALAAGLPRKSELGLVVDGERLRLVVSRGGVRVARDRIGRSYVRLSHAEFTRLILGHLSADEAIDQDRMAASTRLAADLARALFPRVSLWRAPLDFAT